MSEQTQEPSTEVAELVSSINEAKEVIAAETVEIDKKQRKAGRPKGVKDSKPRKIKNELSGKADISHRHIDLADDPVFGRETVCSKSFIRNIEGYQMQ